MKQKDPYKATSLSFYNNLKVKKQPLPRKDFIIFLNNNKIISSVILISIMPLKGIKSLKTLLIKNSIEIKKCRNYASR